MRKKILKALALLLLFLFFSASVLVAAGLPAIDRYVIAGGGGTVAAEPYALESTVGQPIAGTAVISATEVCSGFWCWVSSVRSSFRLDLPLIIR